MKKQTKIWLGAGALVAATAAVSKYSKSHDPLETVSDVDLDRYQGRWYEIARFPKRFEKGCHCVFAEYTKHPKGHVVVYNYCREGGPEGKEDTAKGKAFPVKGSNNSKLKVQFFWPFRGDYWVLELDPDYQHALVGAPDRESLWIISRTPQLDKATYERLVQSARQKGFPVEKLMLTDQSCYQ